MKTFTKKYQVWQEAEGTQYVFTEYDTLNECIVAEKHGDWYITKGVSLVVQEAGDAPALPANSLINANTITFSKVAATEVAPLVDEESTPEEIAAAAAYGSGPIGRTT